MPASLVLAALLFILVLFPHLYNLAANVKGPRVWTAMFETIAMCSGAVVSAAIRSPVSSGSNLNGVTVTGKLFISGKFLFAISLMVFGIQHYMYIDFISTLIPGWIPVHVFWLYAVMIAFFATAISIFLNILVPFSTGLLGSMFLIWLLILHGPLVTTHLCVEPQWSSFFVALAMCGISFMICGASLKKTNVYNSMP